MSVKYGDICDKCAHGEHCDMATFGCHSPKITACYKFKEKNQTNADRIRSMTDEELAEFLNGTDGDFLPTGEALTVSAGKNRWFDWLREEVTDG